MHRDELEPASVLLDRIKEGRKKNAKKKYKELPPVDVRGLPELPEGWVRARMDDIAEIIMGQSPPGDSYNQEGIGFPLINGPVEFGPTPFSRTVKSKYTSRPKKMCKRDDLLLCVRGSTTGRMNISGFVACIGRGVAAVRSRSYQPYLNFFIHSIENQIFQLGTGSTFPNITLGVLNSITAPFPSLSEQYKIVEEIEQRFSVVDKIEKTMNSTLEQAERLRQSILKRAFEGKLVPQNPEDEPASVLLERIKAEKSKKELENQRESKKKSKKYEQKRLMNYDK